MTHNSNTCKLTFKIPTRPNFRGSISVYQLFCKKYWLCNLDKETIEFNRYAIPGLNSTDKLVN